MKKQFSLFDDDGTLIKSTEYSVEGFDRSWFIMYKATTEQMLSKFSELTKLKVFMFILSQQTFDSLVITNMKYIAKTLGISYKSTWLAVKWLIENDFIKKVEKNGNKGFIINPYYSACGRKSLKERKEVWNWSKNNYQYIDSDTGEIIIPDEEIDKIVKETFGNEMSIKKSEEEILTLDSLLKGVVKNK